MTGEKQELLSEVVGALTTPVLQCVARCTQAVANLGPCTCCKASLVSEDYSEDCLQEEGHCHVDTKNKSVVLMLHMSGDLNSAVVQGEYI